MHPHAELATRYLNAINDADVEAIRSIYADDARIWHSFDRIEQTVEQNVASLLSLKAAMPDINWDLERLDALPEGFVLTYHLRANLDGKDIACRACVLGTVRDARIVRIDEWIDVQRLLGRLSPEQLKALTPA